MSQAQSVQNILVTHSSNDFSVFSLFNSSDIVGKSVMLVLILASIYSWAVIISKSIELAKVKKRMENFELLFWSGQLLDELYQQVKQSIDNPLSAVFVTAIKECKKSTSASDNKSDARILSYKDRVLAAMYLSRNREIEILEMRSSFLATIGSSAPFIGLLGTVWGMMNSLKAIAISKNTSLAVVAPGIAEALIATAIGLLVAIPAIIFYNHIVVKTNAVINKIDDFIGELNSLISRAIDEDKM